MNLSNFILTKPKALTIIIVCISLLALMDFGNNNVKAGEPTSAGAKCFAGKCAACHTIGGGPKVGPDLSVVRNWPDAAIEKNVLRMQSKAGPLSQAEVSELVGYLKSSNGNNNNTTQNSTSLNLPGNTSLAGALLFSGQKPLTNGGPSCMTCHSSTGGGNAPPLSKIARKGNKCAYSDFLHYPGNRAMRNAYGPNPITHEEAIAIGQYLNSIPQSYYFTGHGHSNGHGYRGGYNLINKWFRGASDDD